MVAGLRTEGRVDGQKCVLVPHIPVKASQLCLLLYGEGVGEFVRCELTRVA